MEDLHLRKREALDQNRLVPASGRQFSRHGRTSHRTNLTAGPPRLS